MKRATEHGEVREAINLRASLMAKSSAVRMEAVGGNLQAVAMDLDGTYMAAPTDGGFIRREPSV